MIQNHSGWITRSFETFIGPPSYQYCDFVGRTENLVGDLISVLRILGYDDSRFIEQVSKMLEKTVNSVKGKMLPIDLREEVIKKIEQDEHIAIERFYGR